MHHLSSKVTQSDLIKVPSEKDGQMERPESTVTPRKVWVQIPCSWSPPIILAHNYETWGLMYRCYTPCLFIYPCWKMASALHPWTVNSSFTNLVDFVLHHSSCDVMSSALIKLLSEKVVPGSIAWKHPMECLDTNPLLLIIVINTERCGLGFMADPVIHAKGWQ